MQVDQEAFLQLMREQFEEQKELITPDQPFRDLDEWSSMQALIVITAIDEAYGVTISENQLKRSHTFGDLYNLVQSP